MTALRKIGVTCIDDFIQYDCKDGKLQICQITNMKPEQIDKIFMECNQPIVPHSQIVDSQNNYHSRNNNSFIPCQTNKSSAENEEKAQNSIKNTKIMKQAMKCQSTEIEPLHFSNNENSFDGTVWVYDTFSDTMTEKCVAQTKECIKLVPLSLAQEDNDENNVTRGAKGLEENGFSCGILEIPPGSKKEIETAFGIETFFVHFCEKSKLQFNVGDNDGKYLSTGSMLFVPPDNEYELINLSETIPAQLIFTLIKTD